MNSVRVIHELRTGIVNTVGAIRELPLQYYLSHGE